MPRPRLCRRIKFNPHITYFKPQGVPMRMLDEIELTAEEVEALRLKNVEDLDQVECAKKMNTSQSTFQRILSSAYKKISQAIIEGKAINRDLPALKALSSKPVLEDIIKAVEAAFIQQPALSKNISLYLCHKYTTSRLKEIGRYFNIGESAVSQTSRRIRIKINQDQKLKRKIRSIEKKLNLSRV